MTIDINYVISQLLVVIYYLIYTSTFQLKNSKKILIFGIIDTIIHKERFFSLKSVS